MFVEDPANLQFGRESSLLRRFQAAIDSRQLFRCRTVLSIAKPGINIEDELREFGLGLFRPILYPLQNVFEDFGYHMIMVASLPVFWEITFGFFGRHVGPGPISSLGAVLASCSLHRRVEGVIGDIGGLRQYPLLVEAEMAARGRGAVEIGNASDNRAGGEGAASRRLIGTTRSRHKSRSRERWVSREIEHSLYETDKATFGRQAATVAVQICGSGRLGFSAASDPALKVVAR
jgi:hypothetical protein